MIEHLIILIVIRILGKVLENVNRVHMILVRHNPLVRKIFQSIYLTWVILICKLLYISSSKIVSDIFFERKITHLSFVNNDYEKACSLFFS